MQKWRQSLISLASPLMLLPPDPIPFLHEEDKPSSSKQGKATTNHLHQTKTPSTPTHAEMVESKGGESIAITHPKTQSDKPKSAKGARYKGKHKLSQEMMSQYLREGKCFRCGGYGHVSRTCIPKKPKDDSDIDTRPGRYF